jgi:hypothetical protein
MSLRGHMLTAAGLVALAAARCTSPPKEDEQTQALRRRVAELEAKLHALCTPTPVAGVPVTLPTALPVSQPSPMPGAAGKRPPAIAAVGPAARRSPRAAGAVLPDDDMTQMLLDDGALASGPAADRQATTGAAEHWSIPDGAQLELTLQTGLSSRTSVVGDPVIARIQRVADSDGPLPLPGGSILEGRVTRVKPAGRTAGRPLLCVVFDRITVRDRRQALDPITAMLEGRAATGAASSSTADDLELRAGDRWPVTVARKPRVQRD